MSTMKGPKPPGFIKQVEKADDSVLFTSLISSFFHLFSSLLSALSFLCLFLSFLFSSLFSSLSTLSVLFFSSLSLVPPLVSDPPKIGPGGDNKAASKPIDKKEGDKAPKPSDKGGDKGPEKKEGEKGPEKKEGEQGGEKKEPEKKEPEKKEPEKKEPEKKEPEKKETIVEMKVPICEACTDRVMLPLYNLAGVQSVQCDPRREKVTVIATTAAPADILIECVKVFSKSRMWRDGD